MSYSPLAPYCLSFSFPFGKDDTGIGRKKMIKHCRGLQGRDSPASSITALRSLQAMRNRPRRPRFKQIFKRVQLFIYLCSHVYLLFNYFHNFIGYCIVWSTLLRQQCIQNERLGYGFNSLISHSCDTAFVQHFN